MFENLRSTMRFRKVTLDPSTRRLARVANVDDLRALAKRRLPGGVFDYIDGAAEDEVTMRRNRSGFADLVFRPRVLRDVSVVDTSTTLLGRHTPLPLILAPTGFTRIAHSEGELAVARMAQRHGLTYTLSSVGTRSIEEVAAVDSAPLWFQVYVWKDRGLVAETVARASAAGYEALCVTVDLATLGRRERDVRRGFTLPPKLGIDTVFDGIRHPRWVWDFARSDPILFANLTGSDQPDGTDPTSLSAYFDAQLDATLSWDDLAWFRDIWDGPIVVKGIQDVGDALLAADFGADAIALSNHGGRQLDAAPSPIELLPEVRDALGDAVEIIVDGGVRRGADIAKAVCLGATACMAGRPYLYGLGAGGEAGVDLALGFLRDEYERTLKLIGATSTAELGPQYLRGRGAAETGS